MLPEERVKNGLYFGSDNVLLLLLGKAGYWARNHSKLTEG